MSATFVQKVCVPIKGNNVEFTMKEANELHRDLTLALNADNQASYQVKLAVSDAFVIRIDQLLSDQRHAHVAFARQVAMWLHRVLFHLSYNQIAALFPKRNGKPRDHGTVLHAYNVVEKRMDEDAAMRDKIMALHESLRKGAHQ